MGIDISDHFQRIDSNCSLSLFLAHGDTDPDLMEFLDGCPDFGFRFFISFGDQSNFHDKDPTLLERLKMLVESLGGSWNIVQSFTPSAEYPRSI